MKTLIKMAVATSAALGTLMAAEAASAKPLPRQAVPEFYNVQANPNYRYGPRATVQPNDVVSGDRIIGRAFDPFLRGQILREYNSGGFGG